jgi:hypothetical protein
MPRAPFRNFSAARLFFGLTRSRHAEQEGCHASEPIQEKGCVMKIRSYISVVFCALSLVGTCIAVEPAKVPVGSKIFVEGDQGFDVFLAAAVDKKKVPVMVVADKSQADFILEASSQSEKSGWARTIFLGQTGSNEEASIRLINVKTTEVVFA